MSNVVNVERLQDSYMTSLVGRTVPLLGPPGQPKWVSINEVVTFF